MEKQHINKKRLTHYQGLYREENANPGSEYLFSELLQTRSILFDWKIRPHIHVKLYQIFYIESGSFKFLGANQQYSHQGPCIIIVPSAALHGFEYSPDTTGRILTLSDSLMHTLFPKNSIVASMLMDVRHLTRFELPHSPDQITALFQAVDDELFNDFAEKRIMVNLCLQKLFLALYRIYLKQETSPNQADNRSLIYFRNFQSRIREVGPAPGIVQLAHELAISPVHLNRICRAIAGKSAIQIVHEHLLEEARKYLTYTSHSISEISYLLNFDYPNYFSRFFKKHIGMTPKQYRDSQ